MDIEIPQAGEATLLEKTPAAPKAKSAAVQPQRGWQPIARSVGTHGALIIASFIAAFPLILIFLTSLKPESEVLSTSINLLPRHMSLDNYSYVLHDNVFLYARNSILIAVGTMIFSLIITLPAGYALSRFEFLGKQGVMLSFLVTQMFPAPLLLVPLYVLFVQFHLLNSLGGLILAYATTALPFSVWMLKNFFDAIPRELDQAGLVDGLNVWGVFYRIVMPLTIPGIAVVAFYNFINSWNEFMFANLFLSPDPQTATLPLGITHYVFATGAHWQWLCAYAILVTIPVIAFFFWAQRYLISGLTGGSVKG